MVELLQVTNETSNLIILLDEETDIAVYGHVHNSCFVMEVKGNKLLIQVRLVMPYFDWSALKNHRAQYAIIEVEDGELVNILFRKSFL